MVEKPKDESKEQKEHADKVVKLVEKSVMEQLGRPKHFHRIDARPVGDNRFRVNVWAEADGEGGLIKGGWHGLRIVDSFYVHATSDGIVSSSPPLEKKY
jgi:hypothetical protein